MHILKEGDIKLTYAVDYTQEIILSILVLM